MNRKCTFSSSGLAAVLMRLRRVSRASCRRSGCQRKCVNGKGYPVPDPTCKQTRSRARKALDRVVLPPHYRQY